MFFKKKISSEHILHSKHFELFKIINYSIKTQGKFIIMSTFSTIAWNQKSLTGKFHQDTLSNWGF